MSYKVKNYPKPVGSNAKTHIETIAMEFIFGLIFAGSAVMSYDSLLLMFVPNVVLAVAFFIVTCYNIYQLIQDISEPTQIRDIPAAVGNCA